MSLRGRALAGVAAAALAAALFETPAQAIPQPCPDLAVCFYDGANGTGAKLGFWNYEPSVSWFGAYGWNDRIESVVNNTHSYTYTVYRDVNYGGPYQRISPRNGVAQNLTSRNSASSATKAIYV